MKSMQGLLGASLVLVLASTAIASTAEATEKQLVAKQGDIAHECIDPRDGFVFRFNQSNVVNRGVDSRYGPTFRIPMDDGSEMDVSTDQKVNTMRCTFFRGKAWVAK